jgi:ABC-2 type transport system permease protein
MKNIYYIAKREVQSYLVSPIAYVISAAFLLMMGLLFFLFLEFSQEATIRYLLEGGFTYVLLTVLALGLTMRLLAEEQRMGTIELLLTSPVRDWEVVVGKYLGGLGIFLGTTALTLYFPLVLILIGNPDRGLIVSGYLGFLLLGAALLAIGVLASSLTQNQAVAVLVGMAIVIALWLIRYMGSFAGPGLGDFLGELNFFSRYEDFTKGVIDTANVAYYLSVIAACLFLATRAVETRRWR